jgi:hypothetical protein
MAAWTEQWLCRSESQPGHLGGREGWVAPAGERGIRVKGVISEVLCEERSVEMGRAADGRILPASFL